MKQYTRTNEQERYLIESGIKARMSIRAIALTIDRSAKTVSEEIGRNGGYLRYHAAKAHNDRTTSNKIGYSKIKAYPKLEHYTSKKLKEGWSQRLLPDALIKKIAR